MFSGSKKYETTKKTEILFFISNISPHLCVCIMYYATGLKYETWQYIRVYKLKK